MRWGITMALGPSRSSLRRGAWIETSNAARRHPLSEVAPLFGGERGLKLLLCVGVGESVAGRSSLRRGAWIETQGALQCAPFGHVAPLFGGERGLKQIRTNAAILCWLVAPLFGGERGLKPRHRERGKLPAGVAPLFGGERGLKHVGEPLKSVNMKSLLSSEGSVD